MEREDYFFGEGQTSDSKKIYALVIYDIVDNRKRTKFAKILEGYGNRIQKSGFEVKISTRKFEKLLNEIPKFCSSMDTIRVYRISGQNLVYKWGKDDSKTQDDLIIL
ncbi:CRISPR-associated endonuclease Cas2 [[Clostridium] aminophilum]|uniref:CRISPR-associated endonuclease Cas2 n=1 Tax=[Clostridium] aminophilum TaxID=1526 RepID=UPI0004E10E21|nr:CRISPR-associated endonuclease Cas2 [[Clostridium] aminophilum]